VIADTEALHRMLDRRVTAMRSRARVGHAETTTVALEAAYRWRHADDGLAVSTWSVRWPVTPPFRCSRTIFVLLWPSVSVAV